MYVYKRTIYIFFISSRASRRFFFHDRDFLRLMFFLEREAEVPSSYFDSLVSKYIIKFFWE